MKKKFISALFLLLITIFFSCTGQQNAFIPDPDFSVYDVTKRIQIDNITETKDGVSVNNMPLWLVTFVNDGIKAVEQIDAYNDKYVFIGVNEGNNFIVLNKWAENFSAVRDTAIMAAIRIEERMILTASLYPDDEYGRFFETFIKNAYSAEYTGAVKEDIYWFRRSGAQNAYSFFILITIEKNILQPIIRNMMSQASASVNAAANFATAPTSSQTASVNRLRQTFFEGF